MFNPERFGVLGRYSMGAITGSIPATPLASDSHLLHLRWADSTGALMGIRRLAIGCATDGAVFGAATLSLRLSIFRATGWTQNASTNNTDLAPGAGCLRAPTMGLVTMNASLIAANQWQVATTAHMANYTATLDAQPLWTIAFQAASSSATHPLPYINALEPAPGEDYHSIYKQSEGVIIKNPAAFPASGVVRIYFDLLWDELTSI